jgi:phytoene synthase
LLATADGLYERAELGISTLPRDCRRGIQAARLLYAEIGHELRRKGLDSVSRRTVVPLGRKAAVLARAVVVPEAATAAAPGNFAPLEQTRFLVEAVESEPFTRNARIRDASSCKPSALAPWHGEPLADGATRDSPPTATLDQRVEWLVGLFERLERRDRLHQQSRAS